MGLSLRDAISLQDDLIEAYRGAAAQARLRGLAEASAEREAFLLELQKPIVSKYGFEASAKGVQDAMVAFAEDDLGNNAAVRRRNNHLEALLAAGRPLPWYSTVWQTCQLRDEGCPRPVPRQRFPIIEVEENKLADNCVIERVPRRGLLATAEMEALAAACFGGDAARAGQLLGLRKVGASARSLLINLGYRSLGVAAARTLANAFSKDLVALELDISGNNIGPEGARALAASLPETLQLLKLNVSNNRIALAGVEALAVALPRGLEVLHLGLAGARAGPRAALALAAAMPPRLQDLSLDLFGNSIGDEGVLAISRALPKTIRDLSVVLLENQISRKGLFCLDRQIGDPLSEYHLPELTAARFKKVAELEVYEFKEEDDGRITRQLDWRTNF